MESDLPLLDQDRIARAAEGLIESFGRDALAEANRRAKVLRSAGSDAAAKTWESISRRIETRHEDDPKAVRDLPCAKCGGTDLDIPEEPGDRSIVICLDCAAVERYGDLRRRTATPSG